MLGIVSVWTTQLAMAILLAMSFGVSAAKLIVSEEVASAGYITIHIEHTGPPSSYDRSELIVTNITSNHSFSLTLPAAQSAVTLSGLSDGQHSVKYIDQSGDALAETSFIVKHHDLNLALILFALGAVLFVILTVLIVIGMKQTERESV
ncbi:hypothetical protein ACSLBF_16910 [Pseudoalteromonas sp. T1lg65]|uniref:hypothetical protein n=1 Tax=Pseudoalteromonas sp. T1lg65 TaxID=2077101 RepID=UPI003F79DA7A